MIYSQVIQALIQKVRARLLLSFQMVTSDWSGSGNGQSNCVRQRRKVQFVKPGRWDFACKGYQIVFICINSVDKLCVCTRVDKFTLKHFFIWICLDQLLYHLIIITSLIFNIKITQRYISIQYTIYNRKP